MSEEKKAPTSLKRGLPAEANNGLFGAEDRIMGLGVDGRFTAVVTFEVADIVHSEADSTRRPVLEMVHIEPVWDSEDLESLDDIRDTARAHRVGATQLEFPAVNDPGQEAEAPSGDLTIVEPKFEAEAPDGSVVEAGSDEADEQ